MNFLKYLCTLILSAALFSDLGSGPESSPPLNKLQIPYLLRSNDFDGAFDLYRKYHASLGRHDFKVLEQMALSILEEGTTTSDSQKQMIAIYGSGMAGVSSAIDILSHAIESPQPETQLAAIQYLSQLQDDRTEELLTRAMASPFLPIRMEAAFLLAHRKSATAVGQIESLMYRLPPELRMYFPEFFALIGTPDAMAVLRKLIDDRFPSVRIEAILSAARFGRDDLLPMIRSISSHSNPAEQEVSLFALGVLKDSKSLPRMLKLKDSTIPAVRVSALRSLNMMGNTEAKEALIKEADEENLHAIAYLAEIRGTEETLAALVQEDDLQVRMNAAIALLHHKDRRAIPTIIEILVRDARDLGFQPNFSVGRSLMAWKVIPSLEQQPQNPYSDLRSLSLNFREVILRQCLELPEQDFLRIARTIFHSKQSELLPLLTSLLENLRTPEALKLLQEQSQRAGAPLARAYATLACFRLKLPGNYEQLVLKWLEEKKNREMIQFRPVAPRYLRLPNTPFELTPEEHSRLLIESYQALADRHEGSSIDTILDAIENGNPRNRYALAGLLLRALQ